MSCPCALQRRVRGRQRAASERRRYGKVVGAEVLRLPGRLGSGLEVTTVAVGALAPPTFELGTRARPAPTSRPAEHFVILGRSIV